MEFSRDQITKTLSLPPACHMEGKEPNHILVSLQYYPHGKDRLALGEYKGRVFSLYHGLSPDGN